MMILKQKPSEFEGKFFLDEIDSRMRLVCASSDAIQWKTRDMKQMKLVVDAFVWTLQVWIDRKTQFAFDNIRSF